MGYRWSKWAIGGSVAPAMPPGKNAMSKKKKPKPRKKRRPHNKIEPPLRPTDPLIVEEVIKHFRMEYYDLFDKLKDAEKKAKVLRNAAEYADVDIRRFLLPILSRMAEGEEKLAKILGGNSDAFANKVRRFFDDPEVKRMIPAGEPWLLGPGPLKATPPEGKTSRGDPSMIRNLLHARAEKYLYPKELADVFEVNEGTIRGFKSRRW